MGKRNWKRKKRVNASIARERISILMNSAEAEARAGNFARANEYSGLARRVGTRYKVSFPQEYKRWICKKCGSYLHPGINCRVRVKRGRKIYFCENCHNIKRVPYKK